MQPIIPPVNRESARDAIVNLQDALRALLRAGAIEMGDQDRRAFDERLSGEERGVYSDATAKLVSRLQEQRNQPPTGIVDEGTARALNEALRERGLLDQDAAKQAFLVSGRVLREDGSPVRRARVRAFHEAGSAAIRLGEDTTDGEGRYTIRYDGLPESPDILLRVSIVDDREATLRSSEVIRNARPVEVVDVTLPLLLAPETQRRLEGRVVLEHGAPAQEMRLRLYRREFGGGATLLAETTTRETGLYALPYDASGAGGVELRAVDAGDVEVPLSRTLHDLDGTAVLNVAAPARLQPATAEFRRMTADLAPHVGEMSRLATARENADRQDLTLLNRTTGWDARLIAMAAQAAALSNDQSVGLSQEVLYGLLRAGLPSDRLQLARVSPAAAGLALEKVWAAGIVQLTEDEVEDAKERFATFARETSLAVPAPGSRSSYRELLDAAGLDEEARNRFASVYLSHRGDGRELWKEAEQAGLVPGQIRSLQRQGKLAFLTSNSAPMTARLQEVVGAGEPVALVSKGFYDAEAWKTEARTLAGDNPERLAALIPPAYEAASVDDRLTAYAEDMARKVRISYPTQVLGHMLERDADDATFRLGDAKPATTMLLKNAAAQGFRLGQTPVDSFLAEHPDVLDGLEETAAGTAQEGVKTLQRVYQMTPSNEAMPVLLSLGLTSAFDVVAVSQEVFLERYADRFPSVEQAKLVYRKAQQVTSVTYNLFTIARKLDNEAPVPVLSSPAEIRESVRNELIKQFPTMESLLGPMDYCECEHCRSVLSPAAYLVDLLQLVDIETPLWNNFLSVWRKRHDGEEYTAKYKKPYEALIERRPDLPHIALTCENTNTALPYIDLVNEILEYYVAHGKLAEQAAHDTGDATTAELLAEPHNIIAAAYEKLQQARYPLKLPFDLWLETVRRFCRFSETPLWTLLEAFRPTDELFAPSQPYDRAAIFVESLGLSPSDAALFTDTNALARWFELYGFPTEAGALDVAVDAETRERIDLNSAKALARRLGVTYKELVEIIQTGFVNPGLAGLTVLYKLGVPVQSVRFYKDNRLFHEQNKDLLGVDRATLDAAGQARFDALKAADWERLAEVDSFEKRLDELTARYRTSGFDARVWLSAALAADILDDVLVLADTEAGGDFERTTLQYASGRKADPIVFLRINLFVRLWRKLGWTIEEIDRALQAFVPKDTPFDEAHVPQAPLRSALIYLAHLAALSERVHLGKHGRLRWIALWSDLPTTGRNPLYAQLFLSRSVLKSDPVFDDALGQYLSAASVAAITESRRHEVLREGVEPAQALLPADFAAFPRITVSYDALQRVQHLSYRGVLTDADKAILAGLSGSPALDPLLAAVQEKAADFGRLKGHLLTLQGALGLTADEVERVLVDNGLTLNGAPLSLANVSLLYRYSLLAKALELPVTDLVTLKALSGRDPFKRLPDGPLSTLSDDHPFTETLRFVEIADLVKQSGLSLQDLEYLLRHEFDHTGKYRQDRNATLAVLKTLSEGVRAIRGEHAVPDANVVLSEDALRQKLGLALAPDVVERFLAMMNGTVEFTATLSKVLPADRLPADAFPDPAIRDVRYNETRQEQRLTFRGVLLDEDQRRALSPPLPAPVAQVFARLLDDLQAQARTFFDNHLKKQKLRLEAEAGFLDDADFDTLFAPLQPLVEIEANARKLEARHRRVAQAFLPLLRHQLTRKLVVQTVAAQVGTDPQLLESLITDERLLALGTRGGSRQPLLHAFSDTAEHGLTARFFAAADGSGPELAAATLADAETGLQDGQGRALRPAGANSARFEGYLEVPAPGAYRFYVRLDRKDAQVTLRFEDAPSRVLNAVAARDGDEPSEFLELRPGLLYRFSVALSNLQGGDARLLVQGETLAKGSLARLALRPLDAIEQGERALLLLKKSLQVIGSLALTERETRHLLTHAADFDQLDLGQLPMERNADLAAARKLFAQMLRLMQYARTRREMAGGTDELIDVFEAGTPTAAYARIARLTRRQEAVVVAAGNALLAGAPLRDERPVQRLWEALQIVERLGVPVPSIVSWTRIVSPLATAEQRAGIARDMKETIKARFDPETWQRVAQGIFDPLRQSQRDALAAHVMQQRGILSIEQLYEYFLVDPGMEPVVQTSRIRLAIASLQLFIQRCLLNLERHVHPSAINAKQWEWMKRYRFWEANRKIFLFPENWLEPELRDDKTHLFRELEGALLQGDVSSDLVEDAFLTYLRKLDEIARLEIVAMHLEDQADPALNTLHVIGRSHGHSNQHFYRRYIHETWTPWEPISAEISGDHLAPVVWRNRLYLFWVTFVDRMEHKDRPSPPSSGKSGSISGGAKMDVGEMVKLDADTTTMTEMTMSRLSQTVASAADNKIVQVQLHWSEYLHGAWSTHESADFADSIAVRVPPSFDPRTVPIHVSRTMQGDEERGVSIHLGGAIGRSFFLAGRNSKPEIRPYGAPPRNPYSAGSVRATRFAGTGPLSVAFTQRITTEGGKPPVNTTATSGILQQGGSYTLLACDNDITTLGDAEIASLVKPVFYQDNLHTLYIQPNLTEQTIEEWQEWVTRTTQPEPDWDRPAWWKDIVVSPAVPRLKDEARLDPTRPSAGLGVGDDSLLGIQPKVDWVVNPATGVLFDGELVGPVGRAGVDVLSSVAEGQAGSGVAGGQAVVAEAHAALQRAGLEQGAAGLNVVGSSGFNAALARNFEGIARAGALTSVRIQR